MPQRSGARPINVEDELHATPGETVGLACWIKNSGDTDLVSVWVEMELGYGTADIYLAHSWQKPGLGAYLSEPKVEVNELLLKEVPTQFPDRYRTRVGRKSWRVSRRKLYSPPKIRLEGKIQTEIPSQSEILCWLRIHVADSLSGERLFLTICAQGGDGKIGQWSLPFRVLPFRLQEPPQDRLIWFRGSLDPKNEQHYLRESDYRRQILHIKESGFTSLSINEQSFRFAQQAIDLIEQCGFDRYVFLYPPFPNKDQLLKTTKTTLGYYLSDEFDLPKRAFRKIHAFNHAQAKQRGALTIATVGTRSGEQLLFEEAGKQAAPDMIGYFLPSMTEHLRAQKAFPEIRPAVPRYYYWLAHMEKPLLQRLLTGAYLFKSGMEGICPYCYQHRPVPPASPFDPFAPWEPGFVFAGVQRALRVHMATYPSSAGIISTLQWEAMRLGIEDLRYLHTLASLIALCAAQDSNELRHQAAESQERLDALLSQIDLTKINIDSESDPLPYPDFEAGFFDLLRKTVSREYLALHRSAVGAGVIS